MRVAVIDLGTNSTRLLVAEVDGRVRELERESIVTRLGDGVDASGRLDGAAIERVFGVMEGYRQAIDRHGAERVVAVATSAVRDAENGESFRAELCERFGVDARTIPGEEEARLTFLGATAERGNGGELMVIDIGGGSTEFVVGRGGEQPRFHVSTTLGSVRHTERHLHDDPPTAAQLDELSADARRIVEGEVPAEVRGAATAGIAVAGTATQLASIDLAASGQEGGRPHGHALALARCRELLAQLAAVALEERRETPGLDPDRAPTIVAGAAILVQGIEAFGLDLIEVSDADILHGAALDAWAQRP